MRNTTKQSGENGLDRRDFLVLGSVAVAGATVTGLTATAAPAESSILSVGFAAAGSSRLQPADAVSAGDARFANAGVRLTVHRPYQPEGRTPSSIDISSFAPSADGPVPFLALSDRTDRRGTRYVASRATFVAALDADGLLPLAVERVEAAPQTAVGRRMRSFLRADDSRALSSLSSLQEKGSICRFGSGASGAVGLAEGTYFIAVRNGAWDRMPDWGSLSIKEDSVELTRSGSTVDFEYIALKVEHLSV